MNLKEYIKQLKLLKKIIHEETTEDFSEEDEKELLLQATASLFSKLYPLTRKLFERPTDYVPEYLPCHLRNDFWLANTMKLNPVLNNIDIKNILEFIKTSEVFKEARYDYERRIIERQIDNMLFADNYITTNDEYYKHHLSLSPNCDIIFRTCVVDTLTSIGIDRNAIESALERNRTWKSLYMERAFRNRYESMNYLLDTDCKRITLAKKEHREKWLKLRMYEYYQIHKPSVDSHGSPSEYINLSDTELSELIEYLDKISYERITEIEQSRKKDNKEESINYDKENIHDKMKSFDRIYEIDEGTYLCINNRYYKRTRETYKEAYIAYENGEIYYFDTVLIDTLYNRGKEGSFTYSKDYVLKWGTNPKAFDIKNKRIIDDIEKIREIRALDISRIAKTKIKQ